MMFNQNSRLGTIKENPLTERLLKRLISPYKTVYQVQNGVYTLIVDAADNGVSHNLAVLIHKDGCGVGKNLTHVANGFLITLDCNIAVGSTLFGQNIFGLGKRLLIRRNLDVDSYKLGPLIL